MSSVPPSTDTMGLSAGYRVERLLGRGGMGLVWLAHDMRLDRKVALKILDGERLVGERFREQFFREQQLAAATDHPNIVPVYDAGEVDGRLFIAMRYVEGGDLRARMQRGLLPVTDVAELLEQIADALDAAHAHGLVHRDVKPSNVLLAPGRGSAGPGHVYLTDFGLSGPAGAGSVTAQGLGTIDYVAPEQIRGDDVDGRADVYSLGCLLYELLTGDPPYRSRHRLEVLFAHLEHDPPSAVDRRGELPHSVDSVIARALAKSPNDRFRSCGELAAATRSALAVTVRRPHPRRRLVVALAVTVLATGATAAALSVNRDSTPATTSASPVLVPIPADSVVRIDPHAATSVGVTPLEGAASLAATSTAVWVANRAGTEVVALDPATGSKMASVDLGALGVPEFFAAGDGIVWAGRSGSYFASIDVATGRVRKLAGTPLGVAYGAAGLFAPIAPWHVARLDPRTGETTEAIDLSVAGACDCLSGAIAVGDGAVWIAAGLGTADAVFRLDAETGELTRTDVAATVLDLALAAEGVWALTTDDSVIRIDEAGQTVRVVSAGRGLVAVTVGGGSVWVASGRDGTVTRIDPTTYDLTTLRLGAMPIDLVFAGGSLWVSVKPG